VDVDADAIEQHANLRVIGAAAQRRHQQRVIVRQVKARAFPIALPRRDQLGPQIDGLGSQPLIDGGDDLHPEVTLIGPVSRSRLSQHRHAAPAKRQIHRDIATQPDWLTGIEPQRRTVATLHLIDRHVPAGRADRQQVIARHPRRVNPRRQDLHPSDRLSQLASLCDQATWVGQSTNEQTASRLHGIGEWFR
jgi:hypothetical protein